MSKLVEPLYIATLNGSLVRFFAPPDGKPAVPWHSVDDLQQCCGLSAQQRTVLPRLLRKTEFARSFQTIPTEFGLVTIAPHFAAKGFIGAAIHKGYLPPRLEHDYVQAAVTAFQKLCPNPITPDSPWFAWLQKEFSDYPGGLQGAEQAGLLSVREPDVPAESLQANSSPNCWYREVIDPSVAEGRYYEMTKEGVAMYVLDLAAKGEGKDNPKVQAFQAEFTGHYQAMQEKLGAQQRDEAQAVWERWRADPQSTARLVEFIQQFVAMEKMFGPGAGTAEFWQRWT